MQNHNILITNDDGINSPGLLAAVEAVVDIGNVTIVAPSHQQTGTGRGMFGDFNAHLTPIEYHVNGKEVQAYHCDCSPALVVRHGLKTIFKENKPDLLVSGINYGENLGFNITGSGTVGAALEGACSGIPGIAISKQTDIDSHQKYTDQDWSATIFFLQRFAKFLLSTKLQTDIDILKIDVPINATPDTEVKFTRLAKDSYYTRKIEEPTLDSKIGDGKVTIIINEATLDHDSDIYALAVEKVVSVTPLSVDLTSRVNLSALYGLFCHP